MRLLFLAALLALVTVALAWTKEDHEIFDLVSALEAAEGKGTTFYSWLEVPPTASSTDIGKAYRKKSINLHPDKNPGVKNIEERFARLGVIAKILRNKADRERYDFFYKNGVPVWRGTGYYYERFRPGLGTVFVFLALVSSGVQYAISTVNRHRDLERIERLVRLGKAAAYGPKGIPIEGKRKVRVPLVGGEGNSSEEARGAGRMVDLLVDGTDVYLAGPDPILLDESAAPKPLFTDTWAIALVLKAYNRIAGKKVDTEAIEESESDEPLANGNGVTSSAQPVSKVGGKRRKAAGRK